jgi:hypothetical protein
LTTYIGDPHKQTASSSKERSVNKPFTRYHLYSCLVEYLAPLKTLFVAAFEQETKRKGADVAETN